MPKKRPEGKLYLVTGGAGFIGSCFVLDCLARKQAAVLNLDKLTYSGNLQNLAAVMDDPRHIFATGDIGDTALVDELLENYAPEAIINFAAESHVDRSIVDPTPFVDANVAGLCSFLGATLRWWRKLPAGQAATFRFLHISTDEVFGSLGPTDPAFTEKTPYAPNSPYSASKAASDHFVRAFHETYGLPTLITNCSNNYGPRQFPEKLIPLVLLNALSGRDIPIYGKGDNVRDWLHVEDHCAAINLTLERGTPGESYNIGGRSERRNLEVIEAICALLDKVRPDPQGHYARLIRHVQDRPGHDRRYAIDCGKIEHELGWKPAHDFTRGLAETVDWYLNNPDWLAAVQSGAYRNWVEKNYHNR
ncbi:MAG: dTDP-glucose 4,6-dehydratase [Deltaproteobacteria bacterium]|jgi:dTDP-glucose 4,6-dehydratase|nr:dTDP-glucose 4,6-dehydratase [Deltaproteobacteria bacterium]